MAAYSSYTIPCHGYPETFYYPSFYTTAPAPGNRSHDTLYENHYGPSTEPTYAYCYPQTPIPRPASAFPSTRPHSSHAGGAAGRERDARDFHEGNYYRNKDRRGDEFYTKFSPRFNSNGYYATVSLNPCRKDRGTAPRRMRSFSTSHPIPGVDSDDEYTSTEISDGTFHLDRKAPRRAKKPSYNYRGHGYDNKHYYSPHVYTNEEDEEEEKEDWQKDIRHRETYKHNSRHSNTAPRRAYGAKPTVHRERQRHHKPATEEDRRRHNFPTSYHLEFWDPAEEPIILLTNVFDANSLGKWIYDWTSSCYSSGSPVGVLAGELWLLLIALAGKVKRAEECLPMTRSEDSRELLKDFITSGARLNIRLREILKLCENPMLRVSEERGKSYRLGRKSGIVFVQMLFGPDNFLSKTDNLMNAMRLWNLRFDANCGEILRSIRNDH